MDPNSDTPVKFELLKFVFLHRGVQFGMVAVMGCEVEWRRMFHQ